MKKRSETILSLLLCAAMLLPCMASCGRNGTGEQGKTEPNGSTAAVTETAPQTEEPAVKTKAYDVVYAKGYYLTDKTGFEGNSDEAQMSLSTQRFTKDILPEGSVIAVKAGYRCRLIKWETYPEKGSETLLSEGDAASLTVDGSFWQGVTVCAFDYRPTEEGKEPETGALTVSVPETASDRRKYDWNDDETLSILTVGNSFSDDAMEYVWNIAMDAGVKKVVLGNLYYGGCRLEQHYGFWTNNSKSYDYRINTDGTWHTTSGSTFEAAFKKYDWDFISFQESAQEIVSTEKLYTHFADLIAMAKDRCPNAHIIWHMPWANMHANYGNSIETMYRDTMTALRRIVETYPEVEEIITTGTAIQNARTSYVEARKFLRDGWHLSDFGRYIAGLTFFTQLTGMSIEKVSFAPTRVKKENKNYKKIAIEAAMNAAENPRVVTPSVYTDYTEAPAQA